MKNSTSGYVLLAAILVGSTATLHAEPYLVPIDGTDKSYRAKDFGYTVETKVEAGRFHVSITLDEPAAKSFRGADMSLTKSQLVAATSAFGLEKATGAKGAYLNFSVDPRMLDDGEVNIYSGTIDGRPVVENFGGFRMSIKALMTTTAAQADNRNPLDGKVFLSLEKLTGGDRADGTVNLINWKVRFKDKTYSWLHTDVVSTGTYEFDAKTGILTLGGGKCGIEAKYDAKTGVLTWGKHKYKAADSEK